MASIIGERWTHGPILNLMCQLATSDREGKVHSGSGGRRNCVGGIIKMNDMLLLLKHIVIVKPFIITGRADGQKDRRAGREADRSGHRNADVSIHECWKFSCGKFNFYCAYVMQSGE